MLLPNDRRTEMTGDCINMIVSYRVNKYNIYRWLRYLIYHNLVKNIFYNLVVLSHFVTKVYMLYIYK